VELDAATLLEEVVGAGSAELEVELDAAALLEEEVGSLELVGAAIYVLELAAALEDDVGQLELVLLAAADELDELLKN
jgi:hypothetical protein